MEQTVSKGAVGDVVVILGVELVEAVPAELEFALCALHELATTRPHDANLASWAHLRIEDFVGVAEKGQLSEVQSPEVG